LSLVESDLNEKYKLQYFQHPFLQAPDTPTFKLHVIWVI